MEKTYEWIRDEYLDTRDAMPADLLQTGTNGHDKRQAVAENSKH